MLAVRDATRFLIKFDVCADVGVRVCLSMFMCVCVCYDSYHPYRWDDRKGRTGGGLTTGQLAVH